MTEHRGPMQSSPSGSERADRPAPAADFEWPPADHLSVHEIDPDAWAPPHAATREPAIGEMQDAPPRHAGGTRRRPLWLAGSLTAAAIAAATGSWLHDQGIAKPVPAEAGYTREASAPVPPVPATDAGAVPPRLTITATYPVDPPAADAPPAEAIVPDAAPLETRTPPAGSSAASATEAVGDTAVGRTAETGAAATTSVPSATIAAVTAAPAAAAPTAAAPTAAMPAVAAAAATVPAATVPVPTAVVAVAPAELIRGVLRRYEDAYDRGDVATAASLWPSLDRRALTRAFASLARQDVEFERCDIDVAAARGSAVCVGTLTYVPSVGRGVEKANRVTWTFDLARSDDEWRIAGLHAR